MSNDRYQFVVPVGLFDSPGSWNVLSNGTYVPVSAVPTADPYPMSTDNASVITAATLNGTGMIASLTLGAATNLGGSITAATLLLMDNLTVSGSLSVGSFTIAGPAAAGTPHSTIDVTGSLTFSSPTQGAIDSAGTVLVSVSGAGGSLSVSQLSLADGSGNGTFELTNGAMASAALTLGTGSGAAQGTIDGSGTILRATAGVGLGLQGASGTLSVSNAATLMVGGHFTVGSGVNARGSLSLTSGAIVVSDPGATGYGFDFGDGSGAVATVSADGMGTVFNLDGSGSVGSNGGQALLSVTSGAVLHSGNLGGTQSIFVGTGSTLDVHSKGTFDNAAGGAGLNNSGLVTVDGTGSVLNLSGGGFFEGSSVVSGLVPGLLNVTGGGTVEFGQIQIGTGAVPTVADAQIDVSGAGSLLQVGNAGMISASNPATSIFAYGPALIQATQSATVRAGNLIEYEGGTVSVDSSAMVGIGAGAMPAAGVIDISSAGTFAGVGVLSGNVDNDGVVSANADILVDLTGHTVSLRASSPTLEITGTVTGTGTMTIEPNATLELQGPVGSGQTIVFDGSGGTLRLDDLADFQGTIDGIVPGDTIYLPSTGFASGNGLQYANLSTLTAPLVVNPTSTLSAGTQVLRIKESSQTNPTVAPGTAYNIPVGGTASSPSLSGDYFQVSQTNGTADTQLLLQQGSQVVLAVNASGLPETGTGVTVGIISDSFNAKGGYAGAVAQGLLPTGVAILNDASATDEGRGMAEIVHAIAPGAALAFSAPYGSSDPIQALANAIGALRQAGCNVIVDDLPALATSFGFSVAGEPDTGSAAESAIQLAYDAGVCYVTTAGNYRIATTTTAAFPVFGHALDSGALTVAAMNVLATPAATKVGGYITPETELFSSVGGTISLGQTTAYVAKPNITGPDGATSGWAAPGPFFGTSAAAPAVAAVAALVLQASPALKTQPGQVYSILEDTATPFADASGAGVPQAQSEGSGLVNAQQAVAFAGMVPCYAEGTRLRVPCGDVAVEQLTPGDRVVSAAGAARRVVWVGYRRVDCRRHPRPHDVLPYRIQRGAFGDGLPRRDLLLSPDHAVFVAGELIPIRYLANGRTIAQVAVDAITYFHIELETHDIILAEGLPCETYLDTGNRASFTNGGLAIALHADFAAAPHAARCAPLVCAGPSVTTARRRLLKHAVDLGHALTADDGLVIEAAGRPMPEVGDGSALRFILPPKTAEVRLISRRFVPGHTDPTATDMRSLGVAVADLRLDGQALGVDGAAYLAGWHAAEQAWRWTGGDAWLAVAGARTLSFEVTLPGRYWLAPAVAAVRAGPGRSPGLQSSISARSRASVAGVTPRRCSR